MTYYVSPFKALNQLNRELDRFFDDRPFNQLPATAANWNPQVDIAETPENFHLSVDVPGVNPQDIELSLHQGVLTIRGERQSSNDAEEASYTRRERFRGSFTRQFNLPESADHETVTAKSNHGVLEITIPKARQSKPISISVQGE